MRDPENYVAVALALLVVLSASVVSGQIVGVHTTLTQYHDDVDLSNIYEIGETVQVRLDYDFVPGTFRKVGSSEIFDYPTDLMVYTPEYLGLDPFVAVLHLRAGLHTDQAIFEVWGPGDVLHGLEDGVISLYVGLSEAGIASPIVHLTDATLEILSYEIIVGAVANERLSFGAIKKLYR